MPNKEMIALQFDVTMSADNETAEIMVYGQIVTSTKWDKMLGITESDDISAKDFDKALKDARKSGAKRLNLRINSPGGIASQAIAMRTMLLNAQFEEIAIDVDGLCASAATLLTCVPNAHVRMAEGSEYMIHNPLGGIYGTADDMEAAIKRLRNLETSVRGIYANYAEQDDAQIKKWMDEETWFTAQEAVDAGFADEVYMGMQAVACVSPDMMKTMRALYMKVPQHVAEAAPEPQEPVSTDNPTIAAGVSSENKLNSEEDTAPMANEQTPDVTTKDVRSMTLEELRAENPALFDSVMQSGGEQERLRMEEIDALTPIGYEEMAAKAKADGTSAMDYTKMIVKAQREKAANFVKMRSEETAPGATIPGAASETVNPKDAAAMSDKNAADIASYAKQENGRSESGGMF